MSAKRMRVFAGPYGSGKTTIFKALLVDKQVDLGVYINADDIEQELSQTKLAFERLVEKAKLTDDYLVFSENGKAVKN